MREVLGNIREEMDLPGYYKWLDEGEPTSPVVEQGEGRERSLTQTLSMRSDSLLTDLVSSVQEDIQHKLQETVDNIRTRVSIARVLDKI